MTPTSDTGAAELLANLSVGTVVMIALVLTLLRLVLMNFKTTARPGVEETMPWARSIAEILESLIIAGVLVFLIIRPFFVQAFYIPSESMEPTLLGHDARTVNKDGKDIHEDAVHDHIFVNKLAFRMGDPQRLDIIVFKAPPEADQDGPSHGQPPKENILIKRLIGMPGDTIEVKQSADGTKSQVYINGKPLDEPYIKDPMDKDQPSTARFAVNGPLTLKPGQYFVMGDNRNNSNDSRFWGTLERQRVIGKASFIFFPFDRIRVLH
ncbi:MAG TPA: signal peptidase I [Chthonomonadaceae bacterium]|nr:signal peptidase I [Chthonomonadaceae bacterium]